MTVNTAGTKKTNQLMRICAIGLMAALVYAGNYLQIKIPNGVLVTRVHLGNSMCLLAGLLFGPLAGGVASGTGAMLFDLFDPVYIVSAPYTFLSKFAMGFAAGLLNRLLADKLSEKFAAVTSAVIGQLVYIVLYLLKSYVSILLLGGTHGEALAAAGMNAVTSSINAVLAVIISVPLYFALKTALSHSGFSAMIHEKELHFNYTAFNIVAIAVLMIGILFGGIYLANINKIAEKNAADQGLQTKAVIVNLIK